MKYKRFEDLPVWQDAIELAVRIFALTARPNSRVADLSVHLGGLLRRDEIGPLPV